LALRGDGKMTRYADVGDFTELDTDYKGTIQDIVVAEMLDRASRAIDDYCQRKFSQESVVGELYDGRGDNVLILRGYPLISVEKVEIVYGDNGGKVYSSDDIAIDKEAGIVVLKGGEIFPEGRRNISVDYTYGYESVPEPIKMACILLALKMYEAHYHGGKRTYQASSGDHESYSIDPVVLDEDVVRLLEPYRKKGVLE